MKYPSLDELRELSHEDRLRLLENVWDSSGPGRASLAEVRGVAQVDLSNSLGQSASYPRGNY